MVSQNGMFSPLRKHVLDCAVTASSQAANHKHRKQFTPDGLSRINT
ncbi:uncharacterized protein RAG0_00138 [Rhynchosporium agropyri]|uniref:Uncharacterized protein n=2 Tax=Rhynchosporium TaxID=38037 RepID=A0A1E1LYY4_RHYSE|nr:uncharacterized protein RAG0_00138 [Rhynchosporium agropyri]CZT42084.1 uncharacterized protein RSE6_01923 [Rhynchosporium secalis]